MDILDCREQRALYQTKLLQKYQLRLVVIKANYPGADKRNLYTNYLVFKAYLLLKKHLNIKLVEAKHDLEGLIIYLVVDDELETAKEKAINLENSTVGRLLDIDVYANDLQISRQDLGYQPRPCFLCNNLAIICTRNQTHPTEQIKQYFIDIVKADILDTDDLYANLAIFGMINELCKPYSFGTVSINSRGSHQDMDKITFFNSIEAISEGLKQLNQIDTTSFDQLRALGLIIEDKMFKATKGINTHKGTIFLLLLLLAAFNNVKEINLLSNEIKRLTKNILDDFTTNLVSFTQTLHQQHQITGIRGFAKNGFPIIFKEKLYENLNLVTTYLKIIVQTTDTTIIKRGGFKALTKVQELAKKGLDDPQVIHELDHYCLSNSLSCGGSADVLIITIILNILNIQVDSK